MINSHNSDIDLSFYNDKVKEIIDAGIIAEPFTYVPIKAGHMELVGGNALVFGKITEGYDVISLLVETETEFQGITYYGGAIGSEFIVPRINQEVELTAVGDPVLNAQIASWSDIVTYYKDDIVIHNSGGFQPTDYYYICKQLSLNNEPDELFSLYWRQLGTVASMTFRRVWGYASIIIPETIIEGASYNLTIANAEEGLISTTYSYTANPGDLWTTVLGALQMQLIAAGVDNVSVNLTERRLAFYIRSKYFKQTPVFEAGDINTVFKYFTFNYYILTLGYVMKFPILKCGATHGFGIVYKDRAGRTCSVIKNDSLDVYIPFFTENTSNLIESIASLKFKIYHNPPDWAESYEIVYFGNLTMDYFVQLRIDDIALIPNSNGNRFTLNVKDTIDWTREKNNRWKLADYVWTGGDRIRLMGTVDVNTGLVTEYGTLYDYEIEETATQYGAVIGGDYLVVQAVSRPAPFIGETNILAEIYRPKKGLFQSVAYGTGMVFDIATNSYGFKYHKGDVDQTINATGACTIAGEVNNTANDSWKYARLNYQHATANINMFWAESMFPSDWWSEQIISNKLTSNGFPFLDDLSQRQVVLDERIRNGGFLITGTRTNNIAHFVFDDFMDLPKKNGDITGLREVGFTLKVIQLHKETSIYINRIQTFNPDGTEQFTLTDAFLAQQRPMESDFGCQHPDSIMVNGRNLYYWDNNEGVFIRSAPNGQTVLDVKMKRWFKDTLKWIQSSGGAQILETRTGANNEHDEVWLTFRMGDEVRGVIFSERKGRFISHLNQVTESYVHLGNFFAHLYHQRLWIMNLDEGQDWLTWVGVPTYAEIEVVSNIESAKNKVFNAVASIADHLLYSLAKYVNIPQEASGNNVLMESNIPIWDRREGIYFGEILRDENTPGNFVSVNDRKMNGRLMRGRYCFVKLMTEEHDEKVRIDSIVIFSTLSERNV